MKKFITGSVSFIALIVIAFFLFKDCDQPQEVISETVDTLIVRDTVFIPKDTTIYITNWTKEAVVETVYVDEIEARVYSESFDTLAIFDNDTVEVKTDVQFWQIDEAVGLTGLDSQRNEFHISQEISIRGLVFQVRDSIYINTEKIIRVELPFYKKTWFQMLLILLGVIGGVIIGGG